MESKGTFFILIIVVAVLTLALAAMAGYLFLVQGPSNNKAESSTTEVSQEQTYKEEDLTTKALFESKKYFNLKNAEGSKTIAILQAGINIKYPKQIKDVKTATQMEEKLSLYEPGNEAVDNQIFSGCYTGRSKKDRSNG